MKFLQAMIPLSMIAAAACADGSAPLEPTAGTLDAAARASAGAGAVYVQTNDAAGNAVIRFSRSADGALAGPTSYATGGEGSGSGLGNQGAIALSRGGQYLYVVNAGSDEVSGFRVGSSGLDLIGTWPSGGDLPISLTITGDRLYVLHDGSATTIAGFEVSPEGELSPIAGAGATLPGTAPDAAEIAATPDGTRLVVTEKATSVIVTYPVHADGSLGTPVSTPSNGAVPFGFAFGTDGSLIVSEAGGGPAGSSAVSGYTASGLSWQVVSASLTSGQNAACWVAVSPNGRLAYAANAKSATLSGFAVGRNGELARLGSSGGTTATAATPLDLAFSRDGQLVYVLNSGAHVLTAYHVASDGSLASLGQVAVPVGVNGLAAE